MSISQHQLNRLAQRRHDMVELQLRSRGITDPKVLEAFSHVPREVFVPAPMQGDSYEDYPLPIGNGQTISQPFTVAFMAQAARLTGDEKVLEIGTGSGFGAAILAQLCDHVHTVERIPALASRAEEHLAQLGIENVTVHVDDGTVGLPQHAPFDAVIVTAGANDLPDPFIDQLADGGRIVIPIGSTKRRQDMVRFVRKGGELTREDLGMFAFVPLIGLHGWDEA